MGAAQVVPCIIWEVQVTFNSTNNLRRVTEMSATTTTYLEWSITFAQIKQLAHHSVHVFVPVFLHKAEYFKAASFQERSKIVCHFRDNLSVVLDLLEHPVAGPPDVSPGTDSFDNMFGDSLHDIVDC